jgi:hypothetical protein
MSRESRISPEPWEAALWRPLPCEDVPVPVFYAVWPDWGTGVWWADDAGDPPPALRWEVSPRMRPDAVRKMLSDGYLTELAIIAMYDTSGDLMEAVAGYIEDLCAGRPLPSVYAMADWATGCGMAELYELVYPGETYSAAARRLWHQATDDAFRGGFLLFGGVEDIEERLYDLATRGGSRY